MFIAFVPEKGSNTRVYCLNQRSDSLGNLDGDEHERGPFLCQVGENGEEVEGRQDGDAPGTC